MYEKGQDVLKLQPFTHVVNENVRTEVCDFCLIDREPIGELPISLPPSLSEVPSLPTFPKICPQCQNRVTSQFTGNCLDCNHQMEPYILEMKRCMSCKYVHYCSRSCQEKAWKTYHKEECVLLKTFHRNNPNNSYPPDYIRHVARIIIKLKKNGKEEFVEMPNGQKRFFKDIPINYDLVAKDPKFSSIFTSVYIYMGSKTPPYQYVFEIVGKLLTNNFPIRIGNLAKDIAEGFYLGTRMIGHSCAPNAVWIFRGKDMIIRATEAVQNFDDLKISYVDSYELLGPTNERKENLLKKFHFDCKCLKCENLEGDQLKSSLKCPKCKGCVPSSQGICIDCKQQVSSTLIERHSKLKTKLRNFLSDLPGCYYSNVYLPEPEKPPIEIFEYLLNQSMSIFHHFDSDYLKFVAWSFTAVTTEYLFKFPNVDHFSYELKQSLINGYYKHLPKYTPHAIVLDEITFAMQCSDMDLFNEALEKLDKAKEILEISHGENDPAVTKYLKNIRHEIEWKKESEPRGGMYRHSKIRRPRF